MSKTMFKDGFMISVSDAEFNDRERAQAELKNELNNMVRSVYPVLDLDSVLSGLTQNQADAVKEFLSQFTNLAFHQMVKVKTLKFADSPVGKKKVELLKKHGFPSGDFQWDYAGVIDFGAETQQHCLLCGHPLRYGHRFVAENSLSLCLSGGCARHLFGFGPDVLNRMLTQSSTLLGSVAQSICAQRLGKRTDYLDYCCGMVGQAILKADVALMPFYALEEPVQGKHKIACQLLTGERVFYTVGWVKEHIYLCLNLDFVGGNEAILCTTFSKECIGDMLGLKQTVLLLSKFLGVGLLPPLVLVQEINKGLNAGVLNHHIPTRVENSSCESVSMLDSATLDQGLVRRGSDFKSYTRLYTLVDDLFISYRCNVEAIRRTEHQFAGKSDGEIRRAQLKEVKVLSPKEECALYARELRGTLPHGVQLSADGLRILQEYEDSGKVSKLTLLVLRYECHNAGLIFTGSHELWRLLELLQRTSVRRYLSELEADALVSQLVEMLSCYHVLRSDYLRVVSGLVALLKRHDDVESLRGAEWLHLRASNGLIPGKPVPIAHVIARNSK